VKFDVRNLRMVLLIIYEFCENTHISYGHKRHCIYVCTINGMTR